MLPYRAATNAPRPRLTSTMGITQQTSVADDASRISHPHFLGFFSLFVVMARLINSAGFNDYLTLLALADNNAFDG